jgi:hypothetical protein
MLPGPNRLLKGRYCPAPERHLISRRDTAGRVSEDGGKPSSANLSLLRLEIDVQHAREVLCISARVP